MRVVAPRHLTMGDELRKLIGPEIVMGAGAKDLVGNYARNLGARNVLIVTDPGVAATPWPTDVAGSLTRADVRFAWFSEVTSNPRTSEVMAGVEAFDREECDAIVSVGGGSPTDCAKAIGIVSSNRRPILEFEGIDNVAHPIPPLICVPTTAAAADISQFALITDLTSRRKINVISKALVPDVTLIDPENLTTLPRRVAVMTGIDAMSHGLEAFLSNASSELTDLLALRAIGLLWSAVPRWLRHPDDSMVRREISIGATCAGLAFSNAGLGLLHALAHALGGLTDVFHGECVSVLLPRVLDINLDAAPERLQRLIALIEPGGKTLPQEHAKARVIDAVREWMRGLGGLLERRFDFDGPTLETVVRNTLSEPCIVTNPFPVTEREIERVLGVSNPGQGRPSSELRLADVREVRQKILGLGQRSMRKSYYPALVQRIEALERAKEIADQATRATTEFLDIASHELRTPLTSLKLLVTLATQQLEAEQSQARAGLAQTLTRMARPAARLTTIVNDLLDVSRLERGSPTIKRAPTDLLGVVHEAQETFALQFPSRRFIVEAPSTGERLQVPCDRVRIQQVLDNLLQNAVNYSPENRPITIAVSAPDPNEVCISVIDQGIGISPDDLKSVFLPFFRTKRTEVLHESGLGLGLYIAEKVIQLHGGRIGARSSVDSGSTFFFALPT
jgi:alcohol dehydrogenase class IV/nitrogen-specific signal transduction histidine kinase